MPGEQVFICPSCKNYLPTEDWEKDEKPVCRTEDCDRRGEVLRRMLKCPACDKCFANKQDLKEHGQEAHAD